MPLLLTSSRRRAAVAVAAVLAAIVLAGCGGSTTPGRPSAAGSGSSGSSSASPSSASSSTSSPTAAASTPSSGAPAAPVPLLAQGYLPLFPFADLAQARAWERAYPSGGHQPWHLDTAQTTLAFVRYLGFTELDTITATIFRSDGAHVGVGSRLPNGVNHTAAIVHLMRFGSDQRSPWEVVGTDDTSFTVDIPHYGARVRSPVTVGGVITGVDENISVTVRQLAAAGPLGRFCCLPAGGTRQPWSARVDYAGAAPGGVLTLAAATGGHLQQVERFAVTGARS